MRKNNGQQTLGFGGIPSRNSTSNPKPHYPGGREAAAASAYANLTPADTLPPKKRRATRKAPKKTAGPRRTRKTPKKDKKPRKKRDTKKGGKKRSKKGGKKGGKKRKLSPLQQLYFGK